MNYNKCQYVITSFRKSNLWERGINDQKVGFLSHFTTARLPTRQACRHHNKPCIICHCVADARAQTNNITEQ